MSEEQKMNFDDEFQLGIFELMSFAADNLLDFLDHGAQVRFGAAVGPGGRAAVAGGHGFRYHYRVYVNVV